MFFYNQAVESSQRLVPVRRAYTSTLRRRRGSGMRQMTHPDRLIFSNPGCADLPRPGLRLLVDDLGQLAVSGISPPVLQSFTALAAPPRRGP